MALLLQMSIYLLLVSRPIYLHNFLDSEDISALENNNVKGGGAAKQGREKRDKNCAHKATNIGKGIWFRRGIQSP